MRRNWPVILFWLPFATPAVSVCLGPVSSSFLLTKRRRQSQGGCLVALDVNSQSPPGTGPISGKQKRVTPNTDSGCKKVARIGRVARAAVALLSSDQEMERVRPLPPRIQCGQLRSAVRSVFPLDITQVQELSIKTTQKLETEPCESCASETDEILRKYKEARFQSLPSVDEEHVDAVKKVLRVLLPRGWNQKKYPYIPTGHATLFATRREGGSWNDEPFKAHCRTELVYSSGKPRVVTLYSSYNSSVLTSLHQALYCSLRRGGWLLVGSPTNEKVQNLNGDGPYVSVDYRSATDMIRAEYVGAAVQVLKEKAIGLTDEESRCLDVVCELRFEDSGPCATRGQPMGSLMSFPLLCLINRACVDLALVDLAEAGKISWKQFQKHRCLINGDDLLYREFNNSHDILKGILAHGRRVGLEVNLEKTSVSPTVAEINSTVFVNGERRKKTNTAVLKRSAEVSDVVGFLADSIVKRKNFRRLLHSWAPVLKLQVRKLQGPIPPAFYSCLWSVSDALRAVPLHRKEVCNPFPVVPKPAGYFLSREEEIRYISERVARLMDEGYKPKKPVGCSTSFGEAQSIQSALRKNKPCEKDLVLKVLAVAWEGEQRKKLWLEDEAESGLATWAWDERSKVEVLLDAVRGFKQRRWLECATLDAGVTTRGGSAVSRDWGDFVSV